MFVSFETNPIIQHQPVTEMGPSPWVSEVRLFDYSGEHSELKSIFVIIGSSRTLGGVQAKMPHCERVTVGLSAQLRLTDSVRYCTFIG